MKIRIKNTPTPTNLKQGDQIGYSLFDRTRPGYTPENGDDLRKTLPEVPRDQANIEAERGESILADFDGDGDLEHLNVGGKRHVDGGTPLSVPQGAFVFSDTKKMQIGGSILKEFGKPEDTSKKYTPAELAKQYDINKYKAIINDPTSDKLAKDTAKLMLENYNTKLAKLALVQEDKKGFPQGIPAIAQTLMGGPGGSVQPGQSDNDGDESPQMKYGGYLPMAAFGLSNEDDPVPYVSSRSKSGSITPTGLSNHYGMTPEHINDWNSILPGFKYQDNNMDQLSMYRYKMAQPGGQDEVRNMWLKYGLTKKGMNNPELAKLTKKDPKTGEYTGVFDPATLTQENLDKLEKGYTDGMFGARQFSVPGQGDPKINMFNETPGIAPPEIGPSPVTSVPAPVAGNPMSSVAGPSPNDASFNNPASKNHSGDWWMQDKINTFNAMKVGFDLKKYMPQYYGTHSVLPEPTFFDPTRQLAANQEAAGQQEQAAAMFAGPQRARSVGSNIQGQAATSAADILGHVENQNVQVANQFQGIDADIINNQDLRNTIARKTYGDELATVNQQYDNSKVAANDATKNAIIEGISNAQRTGWMNAFTPQYNVDPATGKIDFTKGRNFIPGQMTGAGSGNQLEAYDQVRKAAIAKGYSPMEAHEIAIKETYGDRERYSTDNHGEVKYSSSGYAPGNPSQGQMYQQAGNLQPYGYPPVMPNFGRR